MFNKNTMLEFQKEVNSGQTDVLRATKHLTPQGKSLRVLPPQNGMVSYAVPMTLVWLGNKPYVSQVTFDKTCDCPLLRIKRESERSQDPTVAKLAKDIRINKQYVMCVMQVTNQWNNGQPVNVMFGQPQLFTCGTTLVQGINDIYFDPQFQNTSDPNNHDGIFHVQTGRNIICKKTGEKQQTKYHASGWLQPMAIPAELLGNIPNASEYVAKMKKTDEELTQAVNNHLFGSQQQSANVPYQQPAQPSYGSVPNVVQQVAQQNQMANPVSPMSNHVVQPTDFPPVPGANAPNPLLQDIKNLQ